MITSHTFLKSHTAGNFITKILLLIKVSYHIISAMNIVIGGFEKHRNTSTSFVAPLLIALSMTLNVTLSLSAEALAQAGATKRSGVKSKCNALRFFKAS